MSEEKRRVAVIGGGPAGYVGAIRAAQLGASVVLFERDTLGGTCLNRGCIPTKTYLKTAEYLGHIRRAADRGIVSSPEATVDMPKVVAHKNRVVKTLTTGVAGLLRSNGVEVVKGEAALLSPTEITCGGQVYQAERILLCGGAQAGRLPIPGGDHPAVVTSDTLLELERLPARLCIIGGGVIGCEMACAFQSFGSQVTVVEVGDRLLPTMDEDLSAAMKKGLEKLGVQVLVGQRVSACAGPPDQPEVITTAGSIPCDLVLLSIGRTADLSCLGQLQAQLSTDGGRVSVDEELRTAVPGIYACGDLNGKLMLAHAAFHMAEVAAENAVTGGHRRCRLDAVPSCVYTLPEVASVGLSQAQAVAQLGADRVTVGRFPFMANGRSLASGQKEGFVKVVADVRHGAILGVHMVGELVTELIAEPTALMAMEVTVHEVADAIIHGHPTYAEAFMEACADALGRCIHLPKKK